jgi:hypothetical protein
MCLMEGKSKVKLGLCLSPNLFYVLIYVNFKFEIKELLIQEQYINHFKERHLGL